MYNVVFVADNGEKYSFGKSGSTMFDMDLGSGMAVSLGISQGFSQIGETVRTQKVSGRTINVNGAVYGDVVERKKTMRKILAPFASGKLIFENTHYTRVYVKAAPSFSTVKNDGRFTLQFYAPYPFFREIDTKGVDIGVTTPMFSFPVNYSVYHQFGARSLEKYININNSGDVSVPFDLILKSTGVSENIEIHNLSTNEVLKINGVLTAGETITIYRDSSNVLRAELQSGDVITDILSRIDESSTFFELIAGDNLILATDDENGFELVARFNYSPAVVALYES